MADTRTRIRHTFPRESDEERQEAPRIRIALACSSNSSVAYGIYGEQRVLEKHDEPVDGEHHVPECDNSHPTITFPSPRKETEYTQTCSEDEDTETDVLFEELSEGHDLRR